MTCLLSIKLAQSHGIDPEKTYLEVSDFAAAQIGTSANLLSGSLVRLKDLWRGLMLPSGNDAAVVLAENFGLLV